MFGSVREGRTGGFTEEEVMLREGLFMEPGGPGETESQWKGRDRSGTVHGPLSWTLLQRFQRGVEDGNPSHPGSCGEGLSRDWVRKDHTLESGKTDGGIVGHEWI